MKSTNYDLAYLNRKPVLNIDELAAWTGISKSSLYKYTSEKSIPFYERGKFNFFDRKEIIQWLKQFPVRQQNVPSDFVSNQGTITIEEITQ